MYVRDKINAGNYTPAMQYPNKPLEPSILRKAVRELTVAEIASTVKIRQEYEDAMKHYRAVVDVYRKAEAEAIQRFQSDLEIEHGLLNHPKANLLWSKAWDHGHASGLMDVANVYDDLAELLA